MSGNHELKRSLTDITVNSNVVSLENLNDVNESVFQKTTKKGKLFKGPNWTAYNKENLGSIPRNIEKSLVEDKKDKVAYLESIFSRLFKIFSILYGNLILLSLT